MRAISATELSRNLSEILDSIEHDGESYEIRRHGKVVARVEPAARSNGSRVREFFRTHRPDPAFAGDVRRDRESVSQEPRAWGD